MREIKFRAYEPDTNKMIDVFGINPLTKKVHLSHQQLFGTPGDDLLLSYEPDDEYSYVRIMQYTGLKDKNGVDIYEGDILTYMSCPDKHFFCTCERKPNPDFTDTVVFEYGAFVCPSLERSIDQYTKIGNIWENKDIFTNE